MINTLELEEKLKNINHEIGNQLLTIKVKGQEKEYVIDSVTREKSYFDNSNLYHICLNVRDGGEGCLKR